MDTFNNLKDILEPFEEKWFAELSERLQKDKERLKAILQGAVQFVALKRARIGDVRSGQPRGDREKLPVILVTGINYDQHTSSVDLFTRYLGLSVVENPEANNDYVRQGISLSFDLLKRNGRYWKKEIELKNGQIEPIVASPDAEPLKDYIIVVTNLYPLITKGKWGDYKTRRERAEIISLCQPELHLKSLIEKLAGRIDLFIAHGRGEVWPEFDNWRDSFASPWLKTNNFGAYYKAQITNARKSGNPRFL